MACRDGLVLLLKDKSSSHSTKETSDMSTSKLWRHLKKLKQLIVRSFEAPSFQSPWTNFTYSPFLATSLRHMYMYIRVYKDAPSRMHRLNLRSCRQRQSGQEHI